LDGWKVIQVRKETWDRLGKLKKFPETASFDAVISKLVDDASEKEYTKRLLK